MALETLDGIETIDGFKVFNVDWNHPSDQFIEVNKSCNAITS